MTKSTVNLILAIVIVLLLGFIFINKPDKEVIPVQDITPTVGNDVPVDHHITFDLPMDLTLAGERVPMEDPDVMERLDREIHVNAYWHSNTIFLLKRAHRWLPQIGAVLEKEGVPSDFMYLPLIESDLQNKTSPAGAVGFWQLRESTAKELGLEVNNVVDERYDPIRSTEAAIKYLKKAYQRFGNWTNVAASYNIGMYGLHRRLSDQNVSSYYDLLLNEETSRYVFRILAIKEIYNNPEKYGFDIPERHLYQPEKVKIVEVSEDIKDLVDFAEKHKINYKILKRHNPWLRKDFLNVKRGKTYQILVPEHTFMFSDHYAVMRSKAVNNQQDSINFLNDTIPLR